jgi:hypothetical protein
MSCFTISLVLATLVMSEKSILKKPDFTNTGHASTEATVLAVAATKVQNLVLTNRDRVHIIDIDSHLGSLLSNMTADV